MFYRSIIHHRQFRYLGAFYLHSIARLFAVSIFQIFSGLYIFQVLKDTGFNNQQSLGATALLFALIFAVQALATAPSLWLISKKGLRFSVFWGNIFLVGFFAIMFLAKYDPIFLLLAAILSGLQIGMYWTAFHIYFAELTDDKAQGEEIALSTSLSAIAAIGAPAFGGLIISYGGFGATFLVMTIVVILANLPLKYLPKQKDIISIDIVKTVLALAPKEERKSYLALLGAGVLDQVTALFWPIFVFPILAGYIGVGFMGSLIALIATVTTISIGMLIDKFGAKRILTIFSSLDSIAWIFRAFVATPMHVFVTSGIGALTGAGQLISMDSLIYERARHVNLVAFIVQREIGLAVGKTLFLLTTGALLWFGLPLPAVFIMTAALALLTRLYPDGDPPIKMPSKT